jgi:prolyl-tRNA synthetase
VIAMPGDESLAEAAKLAAELSAAGLDVLYDDREVRPGVKFADADLVGMPVQLIVGAKGIEKGIVERKIRATGERDEIPRAEAVATIASAA